jgi:TfoX/Sxy family transcriptional regulator of competence genes
MKTSQSTIDYLLDQLASLPNVRARKMFGEYALSTATWRTGIRC